MSEEKYRIAKLTTMAIFGIGVLGIAYLFALNDRYEVGEVGSTVVSVVDKWDKKVDVWEVEDVKEAYIPYAKQSCFGMSLCWLLQDDRSVDTVKVRKSYNRYLNWESSAE